jgi:hypothetical protein
MNLLSCFLYSSPNLSCLSQLIILPLAVLRSRMIFMRLLLRVNILMRLRRLWLRLLLYWIPRKNLKNELKFKHMLKLSCSFDSVPFILLKILTEWVINCYILCHFLIPNYVEYHSRRRSRRSRSRIALRLRLWLRPNDAAPCGSGSATLLAIHSLTFRQ